MYIQKIDRLKQNETLDLIAVYTVKDSDIESGVTLDIKIDAKAKDYENKNIEETYYSEKISASKFDKPDPGVSLEIENNPPTDGYMVT